MNYLATVCLLTLITSHSTSNTNFITIHFFINLQTKYADRHLAIDRNKALDAEGPSRCAKVNFSFAFDQ